MENHRPSLYTFMCVCHLYVLLLWMCIWLCESVNVLLSQACQKVREPCPAFDWQGETELGNKSSRNNQSYSSLATIESKCVNHGFLSLLQALGLANWSLRARFISVITFHADFSLPPPSCRPPAFLSASVYSISVIVRKEFTPERTIWPYVFPCRLRASEDFMAVCFIWGCVSKNAASYNEPGAFSVLQAPD